MGKSWKTILIVLISFSIFFLIKNSLFGRFFSILNDLIDNRSISYMLAYLLIGIPLYGAVLILHPPGFFFSSLGFHREIFKALLFTFICSIPMLSGFVLIYSFNQGVTLNRIVITVIAAAFFEELYFRGFLFGQIFRFTGLGFVPAIILPSIIFALLHIYQSQNPVTMVGIFLVTLTGSAFFAWLYIEWDNNLWVPIFLHFFMNLFWLLFYGGSNALGSSYANIFRIITIALVIFGTLYYKRQRGLKLAINSNTLLMKREILTQEVV